MKDKIDCSFCSAKGKDVPIIISTFNPNVGICYKCAKEKKEALKKDVIIPCPQCNSWIGLKYPRDSKCYCEDCGWPDEDFDKEA